MKKTERAAAALRSQGYPINWLRTLDAADVEALSNMVDSDGRASKATRSAFRIWLAEYYDKRKAVVDAPADAVGETDGEE